MLRVSKGSAGGCNVYYKLFICDTDQRIKRDRFSRHQIIILLLNYGFVDIKLIFVIVLCENGLTLTTQI
jgi:hypothetical protein